MALTEEVELLKRLGRVDLRHLRPEEVIVTYDRDVDTLLVHLRGRGRSAVSVPIPGSLGDNLFIRLDRDADEIVGVQIENFLEEMAPAHPFLLTVLSFADLRGITREEAEELRERIGSDEYRRAAVGHVFEELVGTPAD